MQATYHREVNINNPKTGVIPVNVFKLEESFVYEYQLYDRLCSVSSNEFYTFLHLNNGDRIDILNN